MARVKIRGDLAAALAAGPVRRAVDRVTDRAEQEVREHAPEAKVWKTVGDEAVRPAHRHADGQAIPANIPFRLKRDEDESKAQGWDVAAEPLDPSLPLHQRIHCRCEMVRQPGAIAAAVSRTSVQIGRARVSARVTVEWPRIAESEFAEQGGGWLATAARAAVTGRR
ncbi:hypothetical protein ACIHFD_49325 [Nonomuraea sp. NPDC051941]|uniref:hypothetical protein n=1 Tax=Nonomuraea sp. NPDC051941 TaxID=3364373 RepID=UPI0037CB5266